MSKKKTIAFLAGGTALAAGITAHVLRKKAEKTTYKAELIEPVQPRKMGFYEKYVKRGLDVACASAAIICFSPLYIGVALLVKFKLGSPVIFTQDRPGLVDKDGRETVFKMYKFRTMTDERDENGELLPDDVRLTKFGAWLRKTSLDELAEAFNILNGTMSVIGPRPQLVRDMTFMTKEQRMRHTAKPGLSGLAQVNGRNAITWEDKLEWDQKYIKKIGFKEDVRIILETVKKAFIKQEGISQDNMATAEDFGDYLLKNKKITSEEYDKKQIEAKQILNKNDGILREEDLVSIIMPSYNTASYIKESIQSVLNQTYTNWELIIVDDCSTDETDEVINTITDSRIKYFKNKENSGAAISRNKALREARGQWVAFLDSDDLWMPNKLEKQINFMKKNGYTFSYTNYEEIDEDGNKTGIRVTGPYKITKTGMFNYCWPGCLTVMYDASKVGLVQIEDIKKNNDYAMWLKICQKEDCYLLDEDLGLYRKGRSGSVSTQRVTTMIKWHYKLFRNAEKQGIIKSIFDTGRNMIFGYYKRKKYKSVLINHGGGDKNNEQISALMKAYKGYRKLYLNKHIFSANVLYRISFLTFGSSIPPSANLGENVNFGHPMGIVIHQDSIIGDGTIIYQNVTIGRKDTSNQGAPVIGKNCIIGAGAAIIGEIVIGDNVKVGANAVVNKNIPDNCTVVGNPGRIIRKEIP